MKNWHLFVAALLSLLVGPVLSAHAQDTFTLAVVPDTQQEVLDPMDARLKGRMQWFVDNQKQLNLQMVLQCGDLVNWDTPDHVQYERASAAISILDKANLRYALTIGNHDTAAVKAGGSAAPGNVNLNLRNTTTFNRYFPATRQKNLQGFCDAGKVDNAYQTFRAGGLDWLVINLELWARTGPVDWAKKVVEGHPNHNIIIVTHSHLNGTGAIEPRNGGYGDNSPQYVFDNLISKYANIKMVFSGHTGSHAYRTDTGSKGNTIYQFCQAYHSNTDNPVRLLRIDTKQGTIESRVFSPMTGKNLADGSTFTVSNVKWVPAGTLTTK